MCALVHYSLYYGVCIVYGRGELYTDFSIILIILIFIYGGGGLVLKLMGTREKCYFQCRYTFISRITRKTTKTNAQTLIHTKDMSIFELGARIEK